MKGALFSSTQHSTLNSQLPMPALPDPHPLMVLPFVVMLLVIAIAPLTIKHHWERWYHLIALGLGAISVFYYVAVLRHPAPMLHVAEEYLTAALLYVPFSSWALLGARCGSATQDMVDSRV